MPEKPLCLFEDIWLVTAGDNADNCEPEGPRCLVIDLTGVWIRACLLGTFCICACRHKRLYTTPVERRVCSQPVQCTAAYESEDTRCCVCSVVPPEDGHVKARNMLRIIV